jgi:DNA-binding transcriptional MerR regulator
VRKRELLAKVPGLTDRKLDLWTRAGYVRAVQTGPGTGRARRYLPGEEHVAELMIRLHDAGLNVRTAHRAARDLTAGRTAMLGPGIEVTVTGSRDEEAAE